MGKPSKRRRGGLSRREFLHRAGLTGAALSLPWMAGCDDSDAASGRAPGSGTAFAHGVASGDPLADRVILWTHVTPPEGGTVPVDWQMARDPGMRDTVASGRTSTDAGLDYTVKVDAAGLQPDTTYYYRFSALGSQSRIGRTRTLPLGSVDRLRFAVVSCASYPHGFFNVYGRVAERGDLNAVLHVGDYIYEFGNAPGQYGANVQAGGRVFVPDHEVITLADYRSRHAFYKLDTDLQALHAQHPIIAVWDDHETADNSYKDNANNHTTATEGPWDARKSAAIRAYYEWMPIRVTDPDNLFVSYRRFAFGDLVDLLMLETRLLARSRQVAGLAGPAAPLNAAQLNNPARKLLGDVQYDWLSDNLLESTAVWRILGQQVMFGQLRFAGLPELMNITPEALDSLVGQLPLLGTGGGQINADQWDGYRAARQRVFDLMAQRDNIVVLTGDIHTSWAMDLTPDPSNPLVYNPITGAGSRAVEFVTPSVTAAGLPQLDQASGLLKTQNPHMKYIDLSRHGYVVLDVDRDRIQAEWWYVDTVLKSSGHEAFGRAFMAAAGANRLRPVGQPSEPAQAAAPAPPA